jgi:hypothetical protein
MTSTSHNLNINSYSFQELLGLFDLTYDMSLGDLKTAKKKVLMMHPDKSRLPAEYFLFYKKAFDVIVQIYENNNKQNQQITEDTTKYKPMEHAPNKSIAKNISSITKEMTPEIFQNKFNQLFEENMATKPNAERNAWFSKDEPAFSSSEQVSSKNMGQIFDKMKEKTAELVQYRGVQEIQANAGTSLYDEDGETNGYLSCDPFGKLKFDDLRKVHKDQTIFSVSEKDFQKTPTYSSVDHFVRERGKQNLTPLEKAEAEHYLDTQSRAFRENIMKKEHASKLQTMQYEEKNKIVMSSFLQLGR